MYSRILVALDGSKTASHALDTAIRLALDSGAELQALYVIDLPVIAYDVPGYYFGTSTGQLFASADDGESWNAIASYLPAISSVEVASLD